MATFDLGRVTPLYKGDYSASTSYELNDVVLYNGNLYWHVQATATVGILPTDTTVWKLAFADEGVRAEIRGYADDAQASKTAAATSASQASASASNASASASQAASSAQTASTKASEASTSAQTASTKASEASTSAQSAASSAQTATDKATLATNKAQAASESASLATARASAAATSETNAAASAQTATAKASEAAASATSAQEYDESAQQSAVNAQTAQTAAETAQTAAETAQGLAEDARDLAQQYAESIDPEHIYSAYPTDTAEGSIASFADGADGLPLKSLVVNIDPVQDLSQGDPSPTNICPISGWTGANVVVCGKNLFDKSDVEFGALKADGTVNKLNTKYVSGYIKISTNTSYYLTDVIPSNEGRAGFWYDANKNPIEAVVNSSTSFAVISPSNAEYIRIGCYVASVESCQLELGSIATPYEPYNGTTIPINWQTEAGTVYGGKLDVLSGVLTVDRAMVDLGTLTWTRLAADDKYVFYTTDISYTASFPKAESYNFLCSQYANSHAVRQNMPDKTCGVTNNTKNVFCIRDDAYTDAATFKTAMSGVQMAYESKTLIEIQLTPHEVRSLLGQNNVFADTGDTTAEYRADTKMYIERLTEPDADMIADSNIVSGQYFMVGNSLYLATANIASGGQVIVGTNAIRKSLSEALNEINS